MKIPPWWLFPMVIVLAVGRMFSQNDTLPNNLVHAPGYPTAEWGSLPFKKAGAGKQTLLLLPGWGFDDSIFRILPVIEFAVFSIIVFKVRSAIRLFKKQRGLTPDIFSAIKNTCSEILPGRLAILLSTELAVVYYGFIDWKSRVAFDNEFTYHKKGGAASLFYAFFFIILMETIILHLMVSRWSIVSAWIFSGLSVYTAIQLLGIAKSLSKRPISINESTISLKHGILSEVEIPFSNIEKVDLSRKPLRRTQQERTLSPFSGFESHNVIISLKDETEVNGFYGLNSKLKVIGINVDTPVEFKEKVDTVLLRQC